MILCKKYKGLFLGKNQNISIRNKDGLIYIHKIIYSLFFGKENRTEWNKVFEDLVNRGLKKVLIVVSDDFPGIIETVKAVYPYADHQLCFVHLQRNIRKSMTKADAAEFNKELNKIKLSSSFDEAVEKF